MQGGVISAVKQDGTEVVDVTAGWMGPGGRIGYPNNGETRCLPVGRRKVTYTFVIQSPPGFKRQDGVTDERYVMLNKLHDPQGYRGHTSINKCPWPGQKETGPEWNSGKRIHSAEGHAGKGPPPRIPALPTVMRGVKIGRGGNPKPPMPNDLSRVLGH